MIIKKMFDYAAIALLSAMFAAFYTEVVSADVSYQTMQDTSIEWSDNQVPADTQNCSPFAPNLSDRCAPMPRFTLWQGMSVFDLQKEVLALSMGNDYPKAQWFVRNIIEGFDGPVAVEAKRTTEDGDQIEGTKFRSVGIGPDGWVMNEGPYYDDGTGGLVPNRLICLRKSWWFYDRGWVRENVAMCPEIDGLIVLESERL